MDEHRQHTWPARVKGGLRRLWPQPLVVAKKQIILASLGAAIGLVLTSLFSRWLLGDVNPWFVAPMGASAVLLFGVPNSPLAQPWSIIGGNVFSALIGVTVGMCIPQPAIACGVAVGLAIALMYVLRCLHPPGGAVALTAIVGGAGIHQEGFYYVFSPILVNSLCLAVLAIVFNNLAGRRYPHPLSAAESKPAPISFAVPITREDLHEALLAGQFLDIDEEDLQALLHDAEQIAVHRQQAASR